MNENTQQPPVPDDRAATGAPAAPTPEAAPTASAGAPADPTAPTGAPAVPGAPVPPPGTTSSPDSPTTVLGQAAPGYTTPGYGPAAPGYATSGPGFGPTAAGSTPGYGPTAAGTTYALPPSPGYPPYTGYPPGTDYPPAYPPAGPQRRLTRSRSDRWLGGVCGGLARYWNTDPTLLRILTIVLTLATGGAFLIGYVIAWIAIPDEPLAPYGPGPSGAAPDARLGYAAGGNPPYADQAYMATPAPAPRERSYLGWLVVSVMVLIAGALGLLATLLPSSAATPGIIGGIALAVLGVGLLIGTWYGRARWLTVLAIPVALFTFVAVAAGAFVQSNPNWDRWVVEGSDGQLVVGDRTWVVTPQDRADSPLDYRVSAGSAVLDLTALTNLGDAEAGATGQRMEIEASVGAGQLQVLVPADMQLDLTGSVDLGELQVPDEPVRSGSNLDVATTIEPVTDGRPTYIVTLDAAIGVGNLEVLREAA